MSESGELPEPTYQEIREEITETIEPQEANPVKDQVERAEPVKRAEPVQEHQVPDPPKKKWPQRKRKDFTCEKCGKVFSSNTRRHVCVAAAPPEPRKVSPSVSPPAQRQLSYDEVRAFLTDERTRYRAAQRDAWVGSLF
jgi:hypothetical protein